MLSRITAVIVFCAIFFTAGAALQAETGPGETTKNVRVMVMPFDGTSSGNFSYLTDSIRAMIASRLAARQEIEVVEHVLTQEEFRALNRHAVGAEDISELVQKFNTDYLVSGALYSLQTGLKIEVTVVGSGLSASEGTFTSLAVNEQHILSSVENLVEDVAARGLGLSHPESAPAVVDVTKIDTGLSGFSTEHPEKVFKKGLYGGAIVTEGGMQVDSLGVRRSSDLPTMLVSMASGDLNNDGKLEVVAASRTGIDVYRFDETRFVKLADYTLAKGHKVHAVNLADLDGDGELEIYVSANKGIRASSAILGWSRDNTIRPLALNIDWYIRPVEKPGNGLILAGQAGSKDSEDGYVGKNVVELNVSGDFRKIAQREVISLPKNVNLFDFSWADLDGNGSIETVAVDRREKMLVYDSTNSLLWVSEKDYGGSRNFFGPPKSAVSSVKEMIGKNNKEQIERPIIFIPTRLVVVDLDNDGADEIIVSNNSRVTPKLFSNFREYDGGSVVCLSWQEVEMIDVWRTNKINGYVADYTYADLGDTTAERSVKSADSLYIAQVPDKQLLGFSFNSDSKLLKYRLNVSAE